MKFGGYRNENERLKWKFSRAGPMDTVVIPSKFSNYLFLQ